MAQKKKRTARAKPSTEPPEKKTGRPKRLEEWDKHTTILYKRQTAWLRRVTAEIMLKAGVEVKQAEIVRGILDAIVESGIDVTKATSEEDVKQMVLKKMRRTA